MEPESGSRSGFSLKGSAGLIVAVVVVAILLIALPAYRLFFLISVLIGLVIAGSLALWHNCIRSRSRTCIPSAPSGFDEFIFLPRLPCSTQTLETVCMRILARFMLSASDLTHFPIPGVPEIAFLGRSNVGKSSLINSLVGAKLARTSNTPGRTRSINFYEVRRAGQPRPEMLFADLPGYGYAKVSREISADWARFVDPYLHQRSSLALCLVLIDANIPPQESDGQLLEFLRSKERSYVIAATKCDRLSGNQLQQAMHKLGEAYSGVPMVAFSAKTGAGKEELWRQIRVSLTKFPAV